MGYRRLWVVGFKIQVRKEPKDNRTENKYRLNTIGGKGGSEGFESGMGFRYRRACQ